MPPLSEDPTTAFREAMFAAGIVYNGPLNADGKLHRVKASGDPEANSWYVLHLDGLMPAGAFGCWKRQLNEDWSARNGDNTLSSQERSYLRQRAQEAQRLRNATEDELHQIARSQVQARFNQYPNAESTHPYLQAKGVAVHGAVKLDSEGNLFIPLCGIEGSIWTRQSISVSGEKRFFPNGRKQGCFFPLSSRKDGPLIIAEGYATAASCYEATGWAAVAAMDCGNLIHVAKAFRAAQPNRFIVFAADNDRFTTDPKTGKPINPGFDKATEAAKAIGGSQQSTDAILDRQARNLAAVACPEFGDADTTSTDFNDLHRTAGLSAVRTALFAACKLARSFLPMSEVLVLPISQDTSYIGDHILQHGEPLVIAAPPECGKSKFLLQMAAACCAQHEKFLHLPISPSAHNLRWLIIQSENSPARLRDEAARLSAWLGPHGWESFSRNCHILARLKDSDCFLSLTDPTILTSVQRDIDLLMPDIVAFDPLYEFTTGDLNKDQDMRQICSLISKAAHHSNPNRAIVVVHHALAGSSGAVKATGYDAGAYARNSKVLYGWTRGQINLAKDPADNSPLISVSCGKCSDGVKFPPAAVVLNQETLIFELNPEADTVELADRLKNPSKPGSFNLSPETIRALCPVTGVTKAQLARIIMDDCGCSKRSAYHWIRKAILAEALHQASDNSIFRG